MFAIAPKNLQLFDVQSLGAVDSKAHSESNYLSQGWTPQSIVCWYLFVIPGGGDSYVLPFWKFRGEQSAHHWRSAWESTAAANLRHVSCGHLRYDGGFTARITEHYNMQFIKTDQTT